MRQLDRVFGLALGRAGQAGGGPGADSPDYSPLDFSQRYTGTFTDGGRTISGFWEICHDGRTCEHDSDLTYTKVRWPARRHEAQRVLRGAR